MKQVSYWLRKPKSSQLRKWWGQPGLSFVNETSQGITEQKETKLGYRGGTLHDANQTWLKSTQLTVELICVCCHQVLRGISLYKIIIVAATPESTSPASIVSTQETVIIIGMLLLWAYSIGR